MCVAQGHKAVTLVKLEPPTPRSRVKYSTRATVLLNYGGYYRVVEIAKVDTCRGKSKLP